mgnify:CR=1 FL=1
MKNSSSFYPKGVFVNLFTVKEVENLEPSAEYKNDIAVKITGSTEGAEWDKYIFISGRHLKEQGDVTGWGTKKDGVEYGSWKIEHFFRQLNFDTDTICNESMTEINDKTCEDAVGRQLWVLEYENKPSVGRKRSIWIFYGKADDDKGKLMTKWNGMEAPDKYAHKESEKQNKLTDKFDSLPGGDDDGLPI